MDTNSREEYEERCLAEDPDGYELLFGNNKPEEQGGQGGLRVTFLPDGTAETILELEPFCELQREQVLGGSRRESCILIDNINLSAFLCLGARARVSTTGCGAQVSTRL